MSRQTVCVDFDGVIHSYSSGWTGEVPTDAPEPGAIEFITHLITSGYKVVVLTTRAKTEKGLNGTLDWLEHWGFPEELTVTAQKVPAIAYVDDRAVPYNRSHHSSSFEAALTAIERLRAATHTA